MPTSLPTVVPASSRGAIRADFVPDSFEAMYAHYFPYVVQLVARFGIDQNNVEDVAQTILTKFFEKDVLSDFDADYQSEQEKATKAMFRTFLSGFVKSYVRHYLDRQRVLKVREGLSTDFPMRLGDSTSEAANTWLDFNDPGHYDDYSRVEEIELVQKIRARLLNLPSKNAQEQCCLREFFEAVLEQTIAGERLNTAALATRFGVTRTSINNWLRKLRTEIQAVIEENQ